jgi:hypothetical protein
MVFTRRHARPLLTDNEYELFVSSLSDHIGELNEAQLRTAIGRTRRLRDKARDLHQRQARAVRSSAGARGAARTANQRTAKKEIILTEGLNRFEKRLAGLEAAAERAKRDAALGAAREEGDTGPGPNRAARRAKPTGRPGSEGAFMSGSAQAEARAALRGPQTRINASRAAAGRRTQAKRDAR